MTDSKQPHLNGAYYGPSVPPQTTYHRHGRGRGCGCCGSLLCALLKIIIAIIVIVGIAVLVFWLVVRPHKVKFEVNEATLTEFNLSNNTLYYDLALNMTIRNPNKRLGIYYDKIEASPYYEDQRLTTITLTPFYQGHKNTTVLEPAFTGQNMVLLSGSELTSYNSENASGVYSVNVKFSLRVRFKLGKIKTPKYKPKVDCDLTVPLSSGSSASTAVFTPTKCDVDYF